MGEAGVAVVDFLGAEFLDRRLQRLFVGAELLALRAVMRVDHFLDGDGAGHRRLAAEHGGGGTQRETRHMPERLQQRRARAAFDHEFVEALQMAALLLGHVLQLRVWAQHRHLAFIDSLGAIFARLVDADDAIEQRLGLEVARQPLPARLAIGVARFLVAGPISGHLSDRYGARAFASGGLALSALAFLGLLMIPTDFDYGIFALLIFLNGIGSGLFAAPNTTAIMNSVPAGQRGAASGMRATFMNAGMVLSIGVFFSLMIAGLTNSLPKTLTGGLTSHGVSPDVAAQVGRTPPVGTLFAAFLGYNPIQNLLEPFHALARLAPRDAATLTGRSYFPHLIADPFHHGLVIVFSMAIAMSLIAALASLLRGRRYVHDDTAADAPEPVKAGKDAS